MVAVQRALPDVAGHVSTAFGSDMSAQEASVMVTGSVHQAPMLSMWASLFAEIEAIWPDKLDRILKVLRRPVSAHALSEFKSTHGVTPCPIVLVKLLLTDEA